MQVTLKQFVKELRHVIGQNVTQNAISMAKGQLKDMEEYKRKVGFNEGLEAAVKLADAMLRQIEERDDEGDLPPMNPTGEPQ